MSTCDRMPQYVHGTLESLFASDPTASDRPVRLVVCGASASYLERWLSSTPVKVEVMTEAAFGRTASLPATKRTAVNFLRQLEGDGPLVTLQDDLDFAEHWLWRATELAHAIEREEKQSDFVLSLYASRPFKVLNKHPYALYDPRYFFGNQGLYLGAKTRRRLRDYLRANAEAGTLRNDDMMVKDFCMRSRTPIWAAVPSLVQHVGRNSAIASAHFHRSPTFRKR